MPERRRDIPLWSAGFIGAGGLLLAGCSGYSAKSAFTMPNFRQFRLGDKVAEGGIGRGTVLLSASLNGLTCAETRIVLARAEGAAFRTADVLSVDTRFGGGAAAAVADLAPGTYHVAQVACRNGNSVVFAGGDPKGEGVPWKAAEWRAPLASFALANGEVLDAGHLKITAEKVKGFTTSIANRKAKAAIEPSGNAALAEAARLRPELAGKLHAQAMTLTGDGGVTLAKCHLLAPEKALPADGSSHLPEVVAANPAAGPVLQTFGTPTRDADKCIGELKTQDHLLNAAGSAIEALPQ